MGHYKYSSNRKGRERYINKQMFKSKYHGMEQKKPEEKFPRKLQLSRRMVRRNGMLTEKELLKD